MKRREILAGLAGAWPALVRSPHAEAASAPPPDRGRARTWRVRPGDRLAEALAAARDGDTLEIEGEHRGQVGTIAQRHLTLRGVGASRPVLHAEGRHAEGKAILVVRDGEVIIDNLAFRGARVPDGNGAGIRFERGRLRVVQCDFFDNEMGLLTANMPDAELMLESCRFGLAPRHGEVLHHLLYVGRIGRATVRGCHFSGGWRGHLIKSRAAEHHILYNHAIDGPTGEASYELDLPNGGVAFVVGNVFEQSALTQNNAMLSFGAEGQAHADSALYAAHNTFVNRAAAPAWFIRAWDERLPAAHELRLVNNLSAGAFELRGAAGRSADGNLHVELGALDEQGYPRPGSIAASTGSAGQARGLALTPDAEFVQPAGTRPLTPARGNWPGAHPV